ncbi:restriction endonuclease [Kribbella pittospori]|uniref:Restriction endonuclease n=1 Tax=Kribbella pittospori TaxID=722689 RepID=A0A4V2M8M7_9ACTN|nr:restriction endonuclease [Kribbella pittospori]TCC52152.1 restriction endonuclease [Kribbella pittospori]
MNRHSDLEALREGQVLESVALTRDEAAALNSTDLVTVQPGADGWRVTAAHTVGAIRCGDLVIRVRPKIGALQVLRLLARAHGVAGLKVDELLIGVAEDPDITAVLALLFAEEASTAMAAGPMRGYRTEEQTLSVLRGRLRLRDQELRRFGRLVPLEVTVDEWTTDTDENRRIRAACRRLLLFADAPQSTRDRLAHLDRLLADVWLVPRGALLAPWTPSRLNTRLHRLLHLADLVLDQATVEHRVGTVEVHGFVLSMAWLFERLIQQLLTEASGMVRVMAQHPRPLDIQARLTIKPDLEFTDGARVVAVADTKYKLLDEQGKFPNADAYQLVTYCARLGLKVGHLIYAAGEPRPEPFDIDGAEIRLIIHSVDLQQPVANLESQVETLFDNIVTATEQQSSHWRS